MSTRFQGFINDNLNTIVVCACFIGSLYVQNVLNAARITDINARCQMFEQKLDDQYKKIDAIKLDKSVFEATMAQFITIRDDMKEVRSDVKELLKNKR